jgi:D-amino-acid dehydrogenase
LNICEDFAMARYVVVGGGVIGLCAAYFLKERGAEVTVVDARDAAYGASLVNAGWITPSLSDPVPAPGLVRTSMKWMLKADSPLYIHPRSAPKMAAWLADFWRHCNERDFRYGMEATADLNRTTMALYDRMVEAGVSFEMHKDGLLFAYKNPVTMEKDLRALEPLNAYGYPTPPAMGGDEVRAFEPALGRNVQSGYWFPQERSVRPNTLVEGLHAWLEERGVEFRYRSEVTAFVKGGCGISAVQTNRGPISCDGAVIAAGARSGELARLTGAAIPLQGGKGYSLDYAPPPAEVKHPIYLHEARVAVTPFDGAVRLAGTMEFSGINDTIRSARVSAISRTASTMLASWPADPARASSIGGGLRPMTPDGIPVIGLIPGYCNLTVATGHAMLGVTLGPSTGDVIAEILTEGRVPDVVKPFSPARFRA